MRPRSNSNELLHSSINEPCPKDNAQYFSYIRGAPEYFISIPDGVGLALAERRGWSTCGLKSGS